MTKQHARYLREYPKKIALKRRMRRAKVYRLKLEGRVDLHKFSSILSSYMSSKKSDSKKNKGWSIKNLFKRKPSV